jgi:hypothetical protein
MLVLFDNSAPRGLAHFLSGHTVEEARARGWEELANGELIDADEQAGFEVMVTADENIGTSGTWQVVKSRSLCWSIRNGPR